MRFFLSSTTLFLAALPGTVAGIGLYDFPFKQDVQLAVELGLDLGLMFRDHAAFGALTAHFGGNPTEAEYTTIPIDHWNSSVGTYQNRYWVDDQHYRPGGPFENSSSLLQQMLREFHGIGIIWEHRYVGVGAETNSNGDFTTALAGSLHDFCGYLETDPQTDSKAGPDRLAPIYGNKFVAERFASWPIFTPLINLNFGTNCKGLNETIPTSCELGRPIATPDAISWAWQYCTEWGFFPVDNTGPRSLLSRYQSGEYYQDIRNQHFAQAARSGLLPPQPRAEALNEATRAWTIRPSNVYWTGGEFDPWRPMCTLSTEGSAPTLSYSTNIPACGAIREDHLFGCLMENAEHYHDFRMGYEPGAVARWTFITALRTWLPCFEAKGGGTRA